MNIGGKKKTAKKTKAPASPGARLRRKADEKLEKDASRLRELSSADLKKLVRELSTHQIELELQNEELCRAQSELEASRATYADLYDFAPMGYFTFDRKGLIREVNLTGAGLLGVEKRYLVNSPFSGFVDRDEISTFHTHRSDVLALRTKQTTELRLERGDKTGFFAQLESIAVEDVEGNAVAVRSAVSDITARKNIEKALARSEDLYRTLTENSPECIALHDRDLRHLYVNPAIARIVGLPQEAFAGKTVWEVGMPREAATMLDALLRSVLETGLGNSGVFTFPAADGPRDFDWRSLPIFDASGAVREVLAIASDVTARKKAEESLKSALDDLEIRVRERTAVAAKQSRVLESFFKHTQTCMVFLDGKFDFVRVNDAYARACKRDVSDFVGHNHFADYPSDELREKFQRVVDTGEPYSVFGRPFTFPDHPEWGTTYWDLSVSPIMDDRGGVELLVFSLLDVTKRKKVEEEIITLNKQLEKRVHERTYELEAANRELEAFSYAVSHDLKAPLRSIEGFTRALTEDYASKLDETGGDYLARVNSASRRMAQLIDAMLSMARLTRGELHAQIVDLSALAQVSAHNLRMQDAARNVEFVLAEKIKVDGDPSLLQVVIENLLSNAWKFTARREAARIEFGATAMEGKAVYFVRDNGAGLDTAFADKLFRPFKRLHSEAEFPGLGIGLATAHRIILRHNGRIWTESEPGGGATFFFTLG